MLLIAFYLLWYEFTSSLVLMCSMKKQISQLYPIDTE